MYAADELLLHILKALRFAFQVIAEQGTRNFDGTEHYVRLTAAFGVETVFWALLHTICCPHSAEKVPLS